MHAWIRRALCAVGLTGGVVLLGIGLAQGASADDGDGPVTTGEHGILSGNQTGVDADAPVNVSGNQVTVIGQRNHTTATGGSSTGGSSGTAAPTTSGASGIGSGNQTGVDADVPVNVSGNQVTVIGQDNDVDSTSTTSTPAAAAGEPTTTGAGGLVAGNQTALGIQLPVNVSGNQVTVIGQDNTVDSTGSSTAGSPAGSTAGTTQGGSTGPVTSGESGIASGNQTGIAVVAPVDVSGNQLTVIGQDNTATSTAGATSEGPAGDTAGSLGGATTSGEDGLVSGNQTGVAALVPVGASGNQVTVVGQDNTVTSTGGSTTGGSTGPGDTTTGEGGIGSGNQTPVVVQVPVDTSGNQVTVVGEDNTDNSTGGSSTDGGTTPGGTTPGGTVSPPAGSTVTTPSAGSGAGTPAAVSAPGATVLPSTGMPGGLPGWALLGLLLVAAGGLLVRRTAAVG